MVLYEYECTYSPAPCVSLYYCQDKRYLSLSLSLSISSLGTDEGVGTRIQLYIVSQLLAHSGIHTGEDGRGQKGPLIIEAAEAE